MTSIRKNTYQDLRNDVVTFILPITLLNDLKSLALQQDEHWFSIMRRALYNHVSERFSELRHASHSNAVLQQRKKTVRNKQKLGTNYSTGGKNE